MCLLLDYGEHLYSGMSKPSHSVSSAKLLCTSEVLECAFELSFMYLHILCVPIVLQSLVILCAISIAFALATVSLTVPIPVPDYQK